ncbi:MAG: hypothetical protein AAGH43_03300 [Pseudomonadota bacterium]
MAATEHKRGFRLARLFPRRLTMGFGMAVCVAVLVTEALFLLPAAYFWHKANQRDAVEDVRLAWYHASNPAAFLTAEQKARLGQRMINDGLILGGVVFDSAGEPLVVFGERPFLDLNIARLSGISAQLSPTSPALDVHLAPEQTGLSHHIVVRLPTEPIEATTLREVRNFGLSVLFIAGFTALLFILSSIFLVIRPLRAINTSLRRAVENPNTADGFHIQMERRDEIGQISRSLNMLLTSVSVVYQDELASVKKAIEGFGFGILQYDYDDRLVAANPAALAMFQAADFNALRKMNRNCAQPLGTRRANPKPLPVVVGESHEPMLITVHTESDMFTALAYGTIVRREDGSISHQFVSITPMDRIMRDTRRAITNAKKSEGRADAMGVQVQEMRRLLEACLCLLAPAPETNRKVEYTILPDRILNTWYGEALRDNLVSGRLEHGLLPLLEGDHDSIRSVLRQAMLLVYAKALRPRPVLRVDGSEEVGDRAIFTVKDVSPDSGELRSYTVDEVLPHAALQAALSHANGGLISISEQGEAAKVVFFLKASAQTTSGADELDDMGLVTDKAAS